MSYLSPRFGESPGPRERAIIEKTRAARARLLNAGYEKIEVTATYNTLSVAKISMRWTQYQEEIPETPGMKILKEVAAKHSLPVPTIRGSRRFKTITEARSEAAYRIYTETNLSTTQVGLLLRVDHSTVLYHVKKRGGNGQETRGAENREAAEDREAG